MCSIFVQFTASHPAAAMPNPAIPPTMECVVDMGMEKRVAMNIQNVAESNAAKAPNIITLGSVMSDGSTMPFRTVSVTILPRNRAPANSKMPAMMTACLMVIAFEPTDVAMELATSLAPMAIDIMKPTNEAAIKIIIKISVSGSEENGG